MVGDLFINLRWRVTIKARVVVTCSILRWLVLFSLYASFLLFFPFVYIYFFRIPVNLAHHLPPSGLSSRTMDWAARQASAARKKQSSAGEGKHCRWRLSNKRAFVLYSFKNEKVLSIF